MKYRCCKKEEFEMKYLLHFRHKGAILWTVKGHFLSHYEKWNGMYSIGTLVPMSFIMMMKCLTFFTKAHFAIRQTSSMQNFDLQVGHGDWLDIHDDGLSWSCRLAYHFPMQSIHHIGLQKHSLQPFSPSDSQFFCSLMFAKTCMQPMQCSGSWWM